MIFTTAFLCFGLSCFAQSISDLQKKKENAAKEIEYTSRLLKETRKSEKSSLSKLRLINNKISKRNSIISNINNEINIYDDFIETNSEAIQMLEDNVKELKNEYAKIIRMAYKNRNVNDRILFLLSSESFNQAYRRLLYFRRYKDYRENQAKVIAEVQKVLDESSQRLERQKEEKQKLVGQTRKEKQKLSKEHNQQNTELKKLKTHKSSLQKKLRKQQKIERQLEREIQRIIEEESRKNRKSGEPGYALTPEQKLIGDNFEQNKHRLPWPVERGVVVEHFGVHKHPVLNNVKVKNNGINIATEAGAKVRSVFNGEVSRVFAISGGNTAVIVRHGNFLTVYSNLREVVVKKGDKLKIKQQIGTVFTDLDDGNKSILKFQIWKESTKLNPEDWIGR